MCTILLHRRRTRYEGLMTCLPAETRREMYQLHTQVCEKANVLDIRLLVSWLGIVHSLGSLGRAWSPDERAPAYEMSVYGASVCES